MFSILGTIIVGLIVGSWQGFYFPAGRIFPAGLTGILLTIVLGIIGAFVGTFIGRALGFSSNDGQLYAAAGSCLCSVQLCFCYCTEWSSVVVERSRRTHLEVT
jgi:uncharacterized membrane protein YeaQ/YmgE (transglycosylase-associated protein family)